MKRIALGLLAVLVSANSANSETFNGFYAGGALGTEARGTQYNLQNPPANVQDNKYQVGLLGELFAGYGRVLAPWFYLGGELGVNVPATNKQQKQGDQALATSNTLQYKRGIGFSLSARVGHVFDKANLLYAKLGVNYSQDKAIYKNGTTGASLATVSQGMWSFVPGFGFDHKWGHIVGGIEYSYSMGQRITGAFAAAPGQTLQAQRNSHQVMFRVSYMF